MPFLLAGLLPLVGGLVLTVYGVALALGPFSTEYVNTVVRWHVLGLVAMGVVIGVTAFDPLFRSGTAGSAFGTPLLVANVLLGGAIGGTLTGIQSARIHRQRRLIQQSANRDRLVNRLLRHEVLNSVTIIGGHADLLESNTANRSRSMGAITDAVRRIKSTIEEVGTITKNGDWRKHTDLEALVRREIRRAESEHDLEVAFDLRTDDAATAADERIAIVVRELLTNAAVHGGGNVTVALDGGPHVVELSISDRGPGTRGCHRIQCREVRRPQHGRVDGSRTRVRGGVPRQSTR